MVRCYYMKIGARLIWRSILVDPVLPCPFRLPSLAATAPRQRPFPTNGGQVVRSQVFPAEIRSPATVTLTTTAILNTVGDYSLYIYFLSWKFFFLEQCIVPWGNGRWRWGGRWLRPAWKAWSWRWCPRTPPASTPPSPSSPPARSRPSATRSDSSSPRGTLSAPPFPLLLLFHSKFYF